MKSNTLLRQENIRRVLFEIRKNGALSKREIQDITGFSWGTVSSVTSLLVAENYLMTSGKQDTGVGRKPEVLTLNHACGVIVGVDFNFVGVSAVLCDLGGTVLEKFYAPISEKSRETALSVLYGILKNAVSSFGKVLHIAVAVQGEVDIENGVSVFIPNLENWQNVPIRDLITEKFGIDTVILHDTDCILYTEKFSGALKNSENALLIRMDHDIGISAMHRGKILMGDRGVTTEIGTMVIPFGNEKGMEYLKNIVSTASLKKEYSRLSGKTASVSEIADFATKGDKNALKLFANIGTALGIAINNASVLFTPEKTVLFGRLSELDSLFLGKTEETLTGLMQNAPAITVSPLDGYAAAVGATLFAAEKVIGNLEFN